MRASIDIADRPQGLRPAGLPRMNTRDLVVITVAGKVAHPIDRKSPYRIGQDGLPRILPGTGGIVINHRVGDRCVGLAGDHVEPGVSVRNDDQAVKGEKDGQNLALNTFSCVGNLALVIDGPCRGQKGVVTGKHGGADHVLVDFPEPVMRKMRIGDRIQIYAEGLGLRFTDFPGLQVHNCAPRVIERWGMRAVKSRIRVPVTHLIPAGNMGSGIGRDNTVRGDYDIQLFDPETRRRFGLDRLRFGDFVALIHADNRFGRAVHKNFVSVGVVVHGDSQVSGHGPGVVTLMTGEARHLEPVLDRQANLAVVLRLRRPAAARSHATLIDKERRDRAHVRASPGRARGLVR